MTATRFPTVRTERMVLTIPPPRRASAMAAFMQENQSHLAPWSPRFPADVTARDYWEQRLKRSREEFSRGASACFVMSAADDTTGPPLGFCNFTQIVHGPSCACYLGYGLSRRAQGQGFMHEGLRAAIDYMFDEVGLHRVMASYMPTNSRSGAVLRRLGFTVEGYARDYLFINGAWQDHILTALVNPQTVRPLL